MAVPPGWVLKPALLPETIAYVAWLAGFDGPRLAEAVAHALAESSGIPNHRNVNTAAQGARGKYIGSVDRGLWQINNVAHPEVSDAAADSPVDAAKHAYRITGSGRSWAQWVAVPSASDWERARAAAETILGRSANLNGPEDVAGNVFVDVIRDLNDPKPGEHQARRPSATGDPGVPTAPSPADVITVLPNTGDPAAPGEPIGAYGPDRLGDLGALTYVPPAKVGLIAYAEILETGRTGVGTKAISPRVTDLTLDLSVEEVSLLTFTFVDPALRLWERLVDFDAQVKWRDLTMATVAWDTDEGDATDTVTIEAHERGALELRGMRPAPTRNNISPSQYAGELARLVKLKVGAIQPTSTMPTIAPDLPDPGESRLPEDAYQVLQRLAEGLGFWFFIAAGTLNFARPSYIINRSIQFDVWHPRRCPPELKHRAALGGIRAHGSHHIVSDEPWTVSFDLPRWRGHFIRPGMRANLHGVPHLGPVIVTRVRTIAGDERVTIEGASAETSDPTPAGIDPADFADTPPSTSSAPSAAPPSGTSVSPAGWTWPAPGNTRIGGRFGDPRTSHTHKGIDISGDSGDPIVAAKPGTVVMRVFDNGFHGGAGNHMEVAHGDGTYTRYLHLLRAHVGMGGPIAAGQRIADMGGGAGDPGRGRSTGAHLHFEIRKGGSPYGLTGTAVDPEPLLAGA